MSTVSTTAPITSSPTATPLRRLHLARFVFAIAWAALFATTGSTLGTLAAVLLVLYPVVDVAAAIIDARATGATGATGAYVTIAISAITAVGLGVAASGDLAGVLRVWGAWAVVAGLVQLVVAVRRRQLGGQGAMIASGGLSVLAGTSFILSAPDATTMTGLAGYAALGGIFFLVSALRLGRRAQQG